MEVKKVEKTKDIILYKSLILFSERGYETVAQQIQLLHGDISVAADKCTHITEKN
jgi:hypothetical protein